MAELPHTDAHLARVRIYNAALWSRIKPRPLFLPDRQPQPPPQAQAPAPPQAQAPAQPTPQAQVLHAQARVFWAAQAQAKAALRWADADHCFHRVGSTVEITSVHDKKFAPFLNFQGVVRRIVARGTDYKFFVQVQRNALGEPVDSDKQIADLNHRTLYFLREDERGLLPCKTTHIRHLWQIDHPPPPQETQLAKRQRLGGTDGATAV